ncbi:MAG TPA: hypothetical protein VER17_09165 [Tepidisphaeraceae bacterium]|nr:hypothetical protein [Tepidisphaeraceae bacterium]
MFGLIRLAFYGLIGYALYNLYQGFSTGEFQQRFGAQASGGGGGSQGFGGGGGGGGEGRASNMTGAGGGMTEQTQDFDGGSTPHQVGRGVTM